MLGRKTSGVHLVALSLEMIMIIRDTIDALWHVENRGPAYNTPLNVSAYRLADFCVLLIFKEYHSSFCFQTVLSKHRSMSNLQKRLLLPAKSDFMLTIVSVLHSVMYFKVAFVVVDVLDQTGNNNCSGMKNPKT